MRREKRKKNGKIGESSKVERMGAMLFSFQIMSGQFAPIRGPYSPEFKQIVRDLLQKDPEFRPTAADILLKRMPELLRKQNLR